MPLVYIHDDQIKPRGTLIWLSLQGKIAAKDWPEIAKLLSQGYEVYSFDFRGLGESRMNYRVKSADDPALAKSDFDQAYINPLSSVLADYVYNSLLTGRPYFLQLMDDLKIVELFIRSRRPHPDIPLMMNAANDAYGLAARFSEIDPKVKVLANDVATSVDWSALLTKSQEEWPIAYLLPLGAYIPKQSQGGSER